MSTHVYTSIAANYLPKARVLAHSIAKFHPEFIFHLVLVDSVPPDFDLSLEPFDRLITIEDLGWPHPEQWLFQHTVVEASTGVKGAALQKILSVGGCEQVLYFDPDITVLASLAGLLAEFENGSVLLTPHLTNPESTLDAILDNEFSVLKHGIYNLGFLGVRATPDGIAFANWWSARLHRFCFDDIPNGIFTDQRWADLAPACFPGVHVLRDPAYNVATWNLTSRPVCGRVPDGLTVDGKPLVFFHFSGFDSGAQQLMLQKYGSAMPSAHKLAKWYRTECGRMGQAELGSRPWVYSVFDNGIAITNEHRLRYRQRIDLQEAFPNPFSTSDLNHSYYHWFQAQAQPVVVKLQKDPARLEEPLAPVAAGLPQLQAAATRVFLFVSDTDKEQVHSTVQSLREGAAYPTEVSIIGSPAVLNTLPYTLDADRRHHCALDDVDTAFAAALTLAKGDDVYFVRSGVVVPEYWDARLRWTALREIAVASVAPLSALCSVEGDSVENIDRSCYRYSDFQNSAVDRLPSDLLFICGAAAQEVASHFPVLTLGDFFEAASRLRWSHLIADHMSIGTFGPRKSPPFARSPFATLALHHAEDADGNSAKLPTLISVRQAARRRQLHISHSWSGGIDSFLHDYLKGDVDHDNLLLKSIGTPGLFGQQLWLYRHTSDARPIRKWALTPGIKATNENHPGYAALIAEIVNTYGIDVFVISSLIGHSMDVLRQKTRNIIVLHDYYPFCPALNITFKQQCRDCTGERLSACTLENPHHRFFGNVPSSVWLELRKEFSRNATSSNTTLVAPSEHVRTNFLHLMPELNGRINLIPHGTSELRASPLHLTFQSKRLRLVVLGQMALNKGLGLLKTILPVILSFSDVHLVGCGDEGEGLRSLHGVSVIPRYERDALPAILAQIQPDAGLLLSVVPETFSYTLQELIELAIPPIATNLGNFAERLTNEETGFLVEPTKDALVSLLRRLAADRSPLARVHTNLQQVRVRRVSEMLHDYEAVISRPNASASAYFCRLGEAVTTAKPLRTAQVYWREKSGRFREEQSSWGGYHSDPTLKTLRFVLPAMKTGVSELRFDLADRAGFLLLYRMQLSDAQGRRIWDWDGRRTAFDFRRLQSVLPVSRSGPAALLYCMDNDPAIYLPIPEPELAALAEGGILDVQLSCPSSEHACDMLAALLKGADSDKIAAPEGLRILGCLVNGSYQTAAPSLNGAAAQLHAELIAARARVNDLEKSLSWRISAPLRTLANLWLRAYGIF